MNEIIFKNAVKNIVVDHFNTDAILTGLDPIKPQDVVILEIQGLASRATVNIDEPYFYEIKYIEEKKQFSVDVYEKCQSYALPYSI